MNQWIKSERNTAKALEWWNILKAKLLGNLRYYGVSGNYRGIMRYYTLTIRLIYKWLNRRSQKNSFDWEKHFTFDETLPGNDHYHAMDKEDLKLFRKNSEKIFELLGNFSINVLMYEESARKNARRSLVAKKAIPKGKIIEYSDVTWKRPGVGTFPASFTSFSKSVWIIGNTLSKLSLRLCISLTPYYCCSCYHKFNNKKLMHSLFSSTN